MNKETKINQLLQHWPQGTVATTRWLKEQGVSYSLQARYKKSGWIEPLGSGAFYRKGSPLTWQGGVYALQTQLGLPVHIGGRTALALQGSTHYMRFHDRVQLFCPGKTLLPKWFLSTQWNEETIIYRSNFLPDSLATRRQEGANFALTTSSRERAIFECLYLAPGAMDLVECYHLMEGLVTLRPKLVQLLLESCSSIKVKRLFLYMATRANHDWLNHVNLKKVSLGKGKRSLVKSGVYNSHYQITLPQELEELE